ncbi:MAG: hypothetical protein JO339_14735 [Alphaproteobacteria bacterium]|nr:hypothetical protein [Alphaproteobacteria bacterium]
MQDSNEIFLHFDELVELERLGLAAMNDADLDEQVGAVVRFQRSFRTILAAKSNSARLGLAEKKAAASI